MSEFHKKVAAGGKIAVGMLGMGSGIVNGVGRVVAGVMNRRGDLILSGINDGVRHFEHGRNVVVEGFYDWDAASK